MGKLGLCPDLYAFLLGKFLTEQLLGTILQLFSKQGLPLTILPDLVEELLLLTVDLLLLLIVLQVLHVFIVAETHTGQALLLITFSPCWLHHTIRLCHIVLMI